MKNDTLEDVITKDELVDNLIVETWNNFVKLEPTHPDDIKDFHRAIHQLQYVMGMRILRREHPEKYPTYTKK